MKKKSLFFIPLILILLLLPVVFHQQQAAAEKLNTPAPGLSAEQIAQQALQTQLDSIGDPQTQTQLEDKLSALEYKMNLQAEAVDQPQKSLEEICAGRIFTTTDAAQEKRPVGILSVREDFLATQGLTINNMWRGTFQGYDAEIYSGSQSEKPDQGVVILSIPALNLYATVFDPTPEGGLTITEAQGTRFILQTSTGSTRYFDLPAQGFAADLETTLTAADLPPVPTAIYDPCAQFDTP